MEARPTNLRTLQILYGSLMTGVIFFAFTTFLIVYTSGAMASGEQMESIFLTIAFLSLITIPAGNLIFRKKVEGIQQLPSAKKMEIIQAAIIIRAALNEVSAFLSIIGFMMTGSLYVLVPAFIVLAVMGFYFPTRSRLAGELGIPDSDLDN
jgi:hypothetical protein